MINKMFKYNEFLNEKLSDKLSGFDEQGLKKQYEKGEIDYFKYLKLCKENNLQLPSVDEMYNTIYDKIKIKYGIYEKIIMLTECCKLNIPSLLETVMKNNKYSEDKLDSVLQYINNIDCLKILIKYGVNIYYEGNIENVLKKSIRNHNFEIFKYYIENSKSDIDIDIDILELIIYFENIDMIKYIFKNKNISELKQYKLLMYAISYNDTNSLKILIEDCKIDVNLNDGKILKEALKYGYNHIVKYLLEHGLDIKNIKYDDISGCVNIGNYDAIKLLIKYGYVLSEESINRLSIEKNIQRDLLKKLIYE